MSKDTKKNIKGTDNRKNTNSKIPKNLKTQDRQNAMKRISKTRQAKMREEEVKSTLKFGVKLVLVLEMCIRDRCGSIERGGRAGRFFGPYPA